MKINRQQLQSLLDTYGSAMSLSSEVASGAEFKVVSSVRNIFNKNTGQQLENLTDSEQSELLSIVFNHKILKTL